MFDPQKLDNSGIFQFRNIGLMGVVRYIKSEWFSFSGIYLERVVKVYRLAANQ